MAKKLAKGTSQMQTRGAPYQDSIYTVGHSNIELQEFLNLLNGIEVVVDVRSIPFSRYAPQFNATNIKEKLKAAGIQYIFIEDEEVGNVLGGEPRDEACYEHGKVVYEKVMEKSWYQEGISKLVELAGKRKVAIMCSEEDPHKCHRHHLITQSLLEEGVTVFHLRGDRTIEKAEKEAVQPTLL
jgi:uncharacterized protein (DUF488 family)